jgi:hypothetical protein
VLTPGATSVRTCVTTPSGALTPPPTGVVLTVKSVIPKFGCPPACVKPSVFAFASSSALVSPGFFLQVLTLQFAASRGLRYAGRQDSVECAYEQCYERNTDLGPHGYLPIETGDIDTWLYPSGLRAGEKVAV